MGTESTRHSGCRMQGKQVACLVACRARAKSKKSQEPMSETWLVELKKGIIH